MKTVEKVLLMAMVGVLAGGHLCASPASAVSVALTPTVFVPLSDDHDYFTTGGGADVAVALPVPFIPRISVVGEIGFLHLPIWSGDGVNFSSLGGGVRIPGPRFGERLSTAFNLGGGYSYGVIADAEAEAGGNAVASAGFSFEFSASARTSWGLDCRYRYAFDGLGGSLYHGVTAGISARLNFFRARDLQFRDIEYRSVFPVLYKHYAGHPLGSVTIFNDGATPVEDIIVTFEVDGYMDAPWRCDAPTQLAPGESANVEILALFNERKVLDITEATVVSANLTVSYRRNDRASTVQETQELRIYDRHAITWDDDRKAAAYVTFKDPAVVDIASALANLADAVPPVVDRNFRTAMAVHEAFREYGLTYRIDPTTPFTEFSAETTAVDYLQFPRDTLRRRAGDCDDLSILYTAMLESVGIKTAFVTIPGHIYAAFALTISPEQAADVFTDATDYIVRDNRVWIPLEITLVNAPFLEAWRTGAMQWAAAGDDAALIPLDDAWRVYEPVGQVGEFDADAFLSATVDRAVEPFAREMERFIEREIYVQTASLIERVQAGRGSARTLNRLGAINARFGRYDAALAYFQQAIEESGYAPALVNLGNILYSEDRYAEAIDAYERALQESPDDRVALLQLTRASERAGRYNVAAQYYERLKALYPGEAARHAYLDAEATATARASSRAGAGEVIEWVDE